jgi:hypothetical protein
VAEQRVSRAWDLVYVLAFLLASLLAAGCAATPPEAGEREYLDAETAATVTVGTRAIVFARERPELAVNARDYLTLVPVDVNRSGRHEQYFFGYAWSTIDKRGVPGEADAPPRFDLIADGRLVALVPAADDRRDLGLGELPLSPPAHSAHLVVAPTTRETLEFVARAEEVLAVADLGGASVRYELWER